MPRPFLCLGVAALATGSLWAQPAAEAPLTVTGTLVDERGSPVAGVEVVLRPYPNRYELDLAFLGHPEALPEAVERVLSGPEGGFSLSAPLVGPYRLEIRPSPAAAGPATVARAYRHLAPLRVPLHLEPIELPDRHPLTIRALDADGQPVEGAVVIAIPEPRQRTGNPPYRPPHEQPERLHPEFERAAARTDGQGIARFLMPSQAADVVVRADGFAARRANVESGRAALRLDSAPHIILRVRGPDGEPANRAVIRRAGGADEVPIALTGEDGLAAVGLGADERATLVAEAPDGSWMRTTTRNEPARESASEPSVQELLLQPPAVIAGRIADATTGLGVPDSVVWVRSDPGRHTVADSSGGFRLYAPLPQRRIELGAVASDYLAATATVNADRIRAGADVLVGLAPAAPLAGRVVDGFGRPVAGANVQSEPTDDEPLEWRTDRHGRATSGPDGSFWIPNAVYGSGYRLTVEAPSYAPAQHDLPPFERASPVEPVHIVLSQGRQPWGTVTDPEGAPVAGAEIRLSWPSEYPELPASFSDDEAVEAVLSNNRGEFEFATVAPGQYGVSISHPEYVHLDGKPANVPQGAGYFDLGVFVLTPGAEIHGVVSDPDQGPLEGVEISARQRSQILSGQTRTATTDARGRFRLGGLLTTVLADLTATADGYAPAAVESVRPATGEPVLIELARGASLSGRVFNPDGSAAAGVQVGLSVPYTEFRRRAVFGEHVFHSARADNDGRFRFDRLVPARWSLEAVDRTARATLEGIELGSGASREVEINDRSVANVTIRLEPGAEIRGMVTGLDAGDMATVGVEAWQGALFRSASPDLDGSFSIEALAPGTWQFSATTGERRSPMQSVTVDPGAAYATVELHFQPGFRVTGQMFVAGVPATDGFVTASQPGQENPRRTRTDHQGRFEMKGLPAGGYQLQFRHRLGATTEQPLDLQSDYHNLLVHLQPLSDDQN